MKDIEDTTNLVALEETSGTHRFVSRDPESRTQESEAYASTHTVDEVFRRFYRNSGYAIEGEQSAGGMTCTTPTGIVLVGVVQGQVRVAYLLPYDGATAQPLTEARARRLLGFKPRQVV